MIGFFDTNVSNQHYFIAIHTFNIKFTFTKLIKFIATHANLLKNEEDMRALSKAGAKKWDCPTRVKPNQAARN
jgi:hypothetical protein